MAGFVARVVDLSESAAGFVAHFDSPSPAEGFLGPPLPPRPACWPPLPLGFCPKPGIGASFEVGAGGFAACGAGTAALIASIGGGTDEGSNDTCSS
jgi:hypothetical protein